MVKISRFRPSALFAAGYFCLSLGLAVVPALIVEPIRVMAQEEPEAAIAPWIGEWKFSDPEGEGGLTLIFAPDDLLFFILPDEQGGQIAVQMGYSVDASTQPLQLDIAASPEETALTVFEFTPEGNLRLDLDVGPNEPRPDRLGDNAIVLERVSDATAPPEGIQIINLETAAQQSEPSVPVQFMAILLRGQQAYYLEHGKFAADIGELGFATALETEEYYYEMVAEGDSAHRIAIAAKPKDGELPSYGGAVFAIERDGKTIPVAGICQSDLPSTSPPFPLAPTQDSPTIQCPSGSSPIE